MNSFLLDLPFGISLEFVLAQDGIVAARWLWCDLHIGQAEVGAA